VTEILQPEGWPRPSGYANGLAAQGRLVFVAGQIGWNPETLRFETDDFAEQTAQALKNVVAVLRAAGAEPRHVTRMTWYITDKAAYLAATREIGRVWRDVMGRHYPAMSVVVVAGLLEDRAKVEIEATGVVGESSRVKAERVVPKA
jgi:enamine deaminase RidA (YjgF/YER057c/UK114 family)